MCVLVCSQGVCVCVCVRWCAVRECLCLCVCVLVCRQGVSVSVCVCAGVQSGGCVLSQKRVLSPGAQSPLQHTDCCFQTIFVRISSWGRGCINPPPPAARMTTGRVAVKQTLKL